MHSISQFWKGIFVWHNKMFPIRGGSWMGFTKPKTKVMDGSLNEAQWFIFKVAMHIFCKVLTELNLGIFIGSLMWSCFCHLLWINRSILVV